MKTLSLKQKKDWAKLLFLKEDTTQKEIALKTGISEQTISKWIKTEDWNKLRASIVITNEESLRRLYMQVNEITSAIEKKPEGQRYAVGKEADALAKISATIRNLEVESSVADCIEVFKKFLNWLRPVDLEKAKEFAQLQDSFIKTIMK